MHSTIRTRVIQCVAGVLLAFTCVAPFAPPVAAQAVSTPSLTDSLAWDPAISGGVLPNGIRWLVRKNARPEHRVSIRLVLPVGSTAEADDQQGLAHFIEHMNFNGSAHFADADQLVAYLRAIGLRFGADANAYTNFDETVYMLDVPTDRDSLLRIGLEALSDFAGRAKLSDAEIEKERGVVLEEWRLGRGAEERMQRKQLPVVFHDSRYAVRLPIGKPEAIQAAPPSRLRDFYRDWYRPEWMTVIAVGDIEPARMEALIREHFSDLPRRLDTREIPRFPAPPKRGTLVSVAGDREATGSSVSIVRVLPRAPIRSVADVRRSLVAQLFRAMLNARLSEIAHRADPPFLSAFVARMSMMFGQDLLFVSAGVADGGATRGLEALLEETARVREHGFLASELERARRERAAQLETAYAEREKTESAALAGGFVQAALAGEPEPGIEASVRLSQALLPGITLAEVDAFADTLLAPDDRTVLASFAEKPGVAPPTEDGLRATLERMASVHPAPWTERAGATALMERVPAPGKVVSRRVLDSLGVTVVRFANGIEAWLKATDFKADEVLFTAYARGGLSACDSTAFPAAWLAPSVVLDNGVGGHTNADLKKLLAGKLARVSPYAAWYSHGVSGNARPEDLETALQLTYLLFTRPTEDPEAFAAVKKQMNAYLANRANSPDQVFADTANVVNTGGVWMFRTPSAAEIEAVPLAKVMAVHRQRYANAADFTFFFAGNFSVDSLTPLLARYLGSLPSTGKRASNWRPVGPVYPDGVTRVVVKKGVEPKGMVRLTYFSHEPIEELSNHRFHSATSILSDHLRSALRELLGGTYSSQARYLSQMPLSGYGTLSVSFGCDPARADTLVRVTRDEVQRLRTEGPTLEDVRKEQEVQRRELETAVRQNGYWTGALTTTHLMGWDPLRLLRRRERIDLLTPANLQDAFRRMTSGSGYSLIQLEPEAATKPAP